MTKRGPTTPRFVTNWGDYRRWYGDVLPVTTSFTPFAVRGFFENGGVRLFVARVTRSDAAGARLDLATAAAGQALRISAMGPGDWGNRLYVRVAPSSRVDNAGAAVGFRITLLYFRTAPNPFVDPLNPQIAARIARAMDRWRKFTPDRQALARATLERVAGRAHLSRDVREIIGKALAAG